MPKFASILFLRDVPLATLESASEPAWFADLNLDRLVTAVCGRYPVDLLAPFFWVLLSDPESVRYRQETLREVAAPEVRDALERFEGTARRIYQERSLMEASRYSRQKQRCLLDAARLYCTAATQLHEDLAAVELGSQALRGLRDHLRGIVGGRKFGSLRDEAQECVAGLDAICYTVQVHENRVRVQPFQHQPDLEEQVRSLFDRFRDPDAAEEPPRRFRGSGFSHVEAEILDQVADLFPEEFARLDAFCERHAQYVDPIVSRLSREVAFPLAWARFTSELESHGLPVTFPEVSNDRTCRATDTYDMALATKLGDRAADLVGNELQLDKDERVMVVTGPNQGGKTTYARLVGQLCHLAAIGCPVAGNDVRLPLVDRVFTLFERAESADTQRGKLQDDLIRTHAILESATPRSLVILNEVFSSTTSDDAAALARRVIDRLVDLGCCTVCVTFLDELASYRDRVVSLVAGVDPDDPGIRTFRIERRPADGRAYAEAIARKYRLTPAQIAERLAS